MGRFVKGREDDGIQFKHDLGSLLCLCILLDLIRKFDPPMLNAHDSTRHTMFTQTILILPLLSVKNVIDLNR